jgi:diguanylate cyclase (GGDEF)-like protein
MEGNFNTQPSPNNGISDSREHDRDTIVNFEKRNTKVLIVDDDPIMGKLIMEILEANGFPATFCPSGLEALDLIKREDFGMVMTDIRLGNFDGMGLLKASKVINPYCDVIIITGFPTVETAVTAMRFGAAEYFTKPFDIDRLQRAISRLIERRILERKLRVERHQMDIPRFDDETGLFSNRYFHLLLTYEINRCRRYEHSCGILLTRIEGIKDIDTNMSPLVPFGDHVIKFVAHLLRSTCRQIDFIARYAYDEFAFLLPESGEPGLQAVTTRIRHRVERVNEQLAAHKSTTRLAAICGGVTYPRCGNSKEVLLSLASESMQRCRM